MTVHGHNMPHVLNGSREGDALRAGQKIASAEFDERMTQLAAEGVQHAQEYVERKKNEQPSAADLDLMRKDTAAFNPEYVERWKHLL